MSSVPGFRSPFARGLFAAAQWVEKTHRRLVPSAFEIKQPPTIIDF